jgi:hypothetical protein
MRQEMKPRYRSCFHPPGREKGEKSGTRQQIVLLTHFREVTFQNDHRRACWENGHGGTAGLLPGRPAKGALGGTKESTDMTESPISAIKIFSPRNFSSLTGKVGITIFAEIS